MDEKSFAFTTSQLQYDDRLHNEGSGAPNCPYKVKITRQNWRCVCVCVIVQSPETLSLCVYVCVCKEGDQASSADSPVC